MNNKEQEVYRIIDIVISCCAYNGDEQSLRDKVLSPARDENTVLTRCMLARMLAFAGYSNASISALLHRSPAQVRNMLEVARDLRVHNRCYRIAEDESMKRYSTLDEQNANN